MDGSAEDSDIFVREAESWPSKHRSLIDFDYQLSPELQAMADEMRRARDRSETPTREEFLEQTRRNGM